VAAEIFVDSAAWYPLMVRRHPQHRDFARELETRVRKGVRVVTTNLVVAETHALVLHRAGREAAINFVQTVRQTPNLVVSTTPELETDAVGQWLERFAEQAFSFTDAVSFAVMKARGIREVLTLDRHFGAAGFNVVPGP
jgi:predicted nucleic acid-binding protein